MAALRVPTKQRAARRGSFLTVSPNLVLKIDKKRHSPREDKDKNNKPFRKKSPTGRKSPTGKKSPTKLTNIKKVYVGGDNCFPGREEGGAAGGSVKSHSPKAGSTKAPRHGHDHRDLKKKKSK